MGFASSRNGHRTLLVLLGLLAPSGALRAQQGPPAVDAQSAAASNGCQATHPNDAPSASLNTADANTSPAIPGEKSADAICLTLQDAVDRARKFNPQFQSVVTAAAIAHQDVKQSLAGLLPTVTYNNQFIYTQPNQEHIVRFIANNTVHEYVSQGNIHESIGMAEIADLRRVSATAAVAKAKAEIATRGLVVTVVQLSTRSPPRRPRL